MKTFIITTGHCTFDDRVFYKQAVSLAKNSEVYLFSNTGEGSKVRKMDGELLENGIYDGVNCINIIKRNPLLIRNMKIKDFLKSIKLWSVDNEIKPDIVLIHDIGLLRNAKAIKTFFCNSKIVFDSHENYLVLGLESKKLKLFNLVRKYYLFKRSFNYLYGIISVHNSMNDLYYLLNNDLKSVVIRNSSLIEYTQIEKVEDNNSSNKITLIHEGNLTFNRGLFFIVELFENQWIQDNVELKVLGKIGKKEKAMLLDRDIKGIIDCGWIDYKSLGDKLVGDIGIIFFKNELNNRWGLPNKLFNYISKGIPVISVNSTIVKDYIREYNVGIALNDLNVSSMIEAIKIISNDRATYENNINKYLSFFQWSYDEKKFLDYMLNL